MSIPTRSHADRYQAAIDLYSHGQFFEALATIDSSINSCVRVDRYVEFLNLAAACSLAIGKYQEAETYWWKAIDEKYDYAEAHYNLGILFAKLNRLPEAESAYQRSLDLNPDYADAYRNLGILLHQLDRLPEAEIAFRKVVSIRPDFAVAYYDLGRILQQPNRLAEAEIAYRRALDLRPGYAEAHNNLGVVLQNLDRDAEAGCEYERAVAIRPDFVEALHNLGSWLQKRQRFAEAEALYERALVARPDFAMVHNSLGKLLMDSGLPDSGIARIRHAVTLDPMNVTFHSNLAYALKFQSESGKDVLAECRRWSARHEVCWSTKRQPFLNDRSVTRRLRIGYVSADFREHCQSLFTVPLLSHHDHERFEIHGYSSVKQPDGLTQRLAAYTDVWHDVQKLDDEHLAQRIRSDGIDILVDLTMHMADGRPLLFSRKPSPVQMAWLAYPGTTGIDAIDYRLTDPRLDPPSNDVLYSECSLRLPDSFWCYDPLTNEPSVNPLPAFGARHITFGCLNNPFKVSDRTLAMWSDVLQEVSNAELLLMTITGVPCERLTRRIEQHGIDPQRLKFVPFRPRADYLKTYQTIDIALDSFPCNGHTTSLDSFWMGVPVVTRVGETAVGRGGLSQLFNLGLLELAAYTDDDFVRIAVQLATDLPRLARLRQGLRSRMEQSPLMNGLRFARNIESAYLRAWDNWCRSR